MNSASLKSAQQAMQNAQSFNEWHAAAVQADQLSGAEQWRQDDTCDLIDAVQMRAHIRAFHEAIARGDAEALRQSVYESLYRHMGDVSNPQLYSYAMAGTKQVVEDYLDAVESALHALVSLPNPGMSDRHKKQAFEQAAFNLGRPALLLSGGASMGFLHLGVAKAMYEQNVLPDVISGSSLGSLVAAGLGVRTPAERHELLTHTDEIYRFGIEFLSPRSMLKRRAVLNNHQLLRCAIRNIGQYSFAEAHERSGIHLGISVSPSRSRQKPRLLSHISSPDVMVPRAALASCAIPGLFPAVNLRARSGGGQKPYLPAESWVDGSFQGDLPMKRLGRLFNVNQFIVSQANPHSVPFLASRHGRGALATLTDAGLSSVRAQIGAVLKVSRERVRHPRLHNVVEHAYALTEQSYRGDINIHPPVSPWLYARLLSNPSQADLRRYTDIGQRMTWPKIAMIRNTTRISQLVRQLAAD